MWELQSPDQKNRIQIFETDHEVQMHVFRNDNMLFTMHFSVALEKEEISLESGVPSSQDNIREAYHLPWGKMQTYEVSGTEMTLSYDGLRLRLRADVQGVAFRYELTGCGTDAIKRENTLLVFSSGFDSMYAMDLFPTYERPYELRSWEQADNQLLGMPVLLHGQNIWALASEADLLSRAEYCSCHWVGHRNRTLSLEFALEEEGKPIPADLPFCSPWRYITLADNLNDLVQSHFNFDLCAPSKIMDLSWIRPARALWAWWEYENGAQLYSESRHYVDTAAEMGFEAVTLDCGWDANWVPQLCEYAHRKGVQLWLWTGRQRVDTPEKMEQYLPLWASWGIDGLKIDFFENDSRETMRIYRMLLERTAELHLMVNFHGATKPAGDGRTWPHLMTSEGIMGIEHYKWSDMPDAVHNCTVPFTRNIAGPMDYTPVGYSNPNRNTTHAHQLALPVVFDSGVTHYALSVYHLEGWSGTDFLRRTKAAYDEAKLLSGTPGKDITMLRRSGKEYFIGILTVEKQQMVLPLDFLPDGMFEAEIYEDDEKDQMLSIRKIHVTRESKLRLPLKPCGGAAIYIAPNIANIPKDSRCLQCFEPSMFRMGQGSEFMRFVDGTPGALLYGRISFDYAISQAGNYTLRIWYSAVGEVALVIRNGRHEARHTLPAGRTQFDVRTWDIPLNVGQLTETIEIERAGNEVPAIARIELLKMETPDWITFGKEFAALYGKAEWVKTGGDEWAAVGIGYNSSIIYHVQADRTGKYILRIRYSGGESRNLSILINHQEQINTYLHSTSGWGFPTWDNIEYKEYIVCLQKGENEIKLFNDTGAVSHIYSIGISFFGD